MNYKPELGLFGNVKRTFTELNHTNNKVFNETNTRERADRENREIIEQTRTDVYLNDIETQQSITELQLQQLGG